MIDQISAAYNSGDIDALVVLCRPDIVYWSAAGGFRGGVDAVREHLDLLHQAAPGQRMRTKTVVAGEDLVVAEFEVTGTNLAEEGYSINFTAVLELHNGRVATATIYFDPEEIGRALT